MASPTESTELLPFAAWIYDDADAPAALFARLLAELQQQGMVVAGTLQEMRQVKGRLKCTVYFKNIADGQMHLMSEDRGCEARGCRIDRGAMARLAHDIVITLSQRRPGLVMLHKYGKVEAEGGGMREMLIEALNLDIPVLLGVPRENLEAWQAFAGELAQSIDGNRESLKRWLQEALPEIKLSSLRT